MTEFTYLDQGGLTDKGLCRKENEDALIALPELGLFCVSDGVGGHVGGEIASQAVVDGLRQSIGAIGVERQFESRVAKIKESIQKANGWIWDQAEKWHAKGMGATAVLLAFDPEHPGQARIMHAGDSRGYRFRKNKLTPLTIDHNVGNLMGKQADGLETKRAAVLTRAVGINSLIELSETPLTVDGGDVFLLCSDGLNKMLTDRQLAEFFRQEMTTSAEAMAQKLVAAANAAGGRDNVSVIVVKVSNALPVSAGAEDAALTQTAEGDRVGLAGRWQPILVKIGLGGILMAVAVYAGLSYLFPGSASFREQYAARQTVPEYQKQVIELKHQVEQKKAAVLASAENQQAEEWLEKARLAISRRQYAKALEAYRGAIAGFDAVLAKADKTAGAAAEKMATEAMLQELIKNAGSAQKQADNARAAAEKSPPAIKELDLWKSAMDLDQQAVGLFAKSDYASATAKWHDATAKFVEAKNFAIKNAAEIAQQQTVAKAKAEAAQKQAAETARGQAKMIRGEAEAAQATALAKALFEAAKELEKEANGFSTQANYVEATAKWNEATVQFTAAKKAAIKKAAEIAEQQAIARTQADAAQKQAIAAQTSAETAKADALAPLIFREAEELMRTASGLFAQPDYPAATAKWNEATAKFTIAKDEASRIAVAAAQQQVARSLAETVQKQSADARNLAEVAKANSLAKESFQAAKDLEIAAQGLFDRQDYAGATKIWRSATAKFIEAKTAVEILPPPPNKDKLVAEKARSAAESARKKAEEAGNNAKVAGIAETYLKEVKDLKTEDEALQLYGKGDYQAAAQRWDDVRKQYEEALKKIQENKNEASRLATKESFEIILSEENRLKMKWIPEKKYWQSEPISYALRSEICPGFKPSKNKNSIYLSPEADKTGFLNAFKSKDVTIKKLQDYPDYEFRLRKTGDPKDQPIGSFCIFLVPKNEK
jgi:serine/threonine protein phosphatase PrpC